MRKLLFTILLFAGIFAQAQEIIPGRVINKENKEPLPYARIEIPGQETILTNIDGSFQVKLSEENKQVTISYLGFEKMVITINKSTKYIQVGLTPSYEKLETVFIDRKNPAELIIRRAIDARKRNDPEKALRKFEYTSYSKFIIDNEQGAMQLSADSTSRAMRTIMNQGRAYLSEKVSEHHFDKLRGEREKVIGIETPGFSEPVYNVLAMEVNPLSIYKDDYRLFKTVYAGPLGKSALKNYEYKILDTIQGEYPAYMIYFKPRRAKVVAGLEGVLYLDMESLAVQKARAQLLGAIKLEVIHDYKYYPEKEVWFPSSQTTTIKPGSGGKEIAVFGGTISIGTVQKKKSPLDIIFSSEDISQNLYLYSEIDIYDVKLESGDPDQSYKSDITVTDEALTRDSIFWKENRTSDFSLRDRATRRRVDSLIKARNVERKIEVKNSLATGSYPIGFWNLDLSKIFKFNNYEGIRLGFGGRTNDLISDKFNFNGYTTYGFKDEVLKFGAGTEFYLDKRNGTNLNFFVSRDIRETAAFDYIKGQNTFSILNPRFVNINFFHNYRTYWMGLEHRITPNLDTELRLGREEIWQIRDYKYLFEDREFSDYSLTTATFSFLWRPFSKFLSTPEENILVERRFPQFTGQIQQAINILDGDFTFTRVGLKVEHEIKQLDRSRTAFILEGNYGFGDLPLTHMFHAYPNSPNRPKVLKRFSVAGSNSFETMYFNEFYSDKQVMLHVKHQLRPFQISPDFQPELVFISRHAIGDFEDNQQHKNVSFQSLEHGYSEVGMELNKILTGFGLSTAYRYGAYHLPTFRENFSFKFTLQLEL